MKRIWLVSISLILGACLTPPETTPPTVTLSITPSPSATVEWFPPTFTPEITPTTEIVPTQAVFSELGEVIFRDEFDTVEEWTLPITSSGQITISNGEANIIINEPRSYLFGTRQKPDFTTFYAEITANPILCNGRDEYGFMFRVTGNSQYYRFVISCEGEIRLDKITTGGPLILYPMTRSASVPAGAPSISKMAVLAEADQIHLFINGDYQASIADQQLKAGSFGIYAYTFGETALTVSFSELIVREILEK